MRIALFAVFVSFGDCASAQANDFASLAEMVDAMDLQACFVADQTIILGVGETTEGIVGLGAFGGATVTRDDLRVIATTDNAVFVVAESKVTIVNGGEVLTGRCTSIAQTLAEIVASSDFAQSASSGIGGSNDEAAREAERRLSERESILAVKSQNFDKKVRELDQREADINAREEALKANGG